MIRELSDVIFLTCGEQLYIVCFEDFEMEPPIFLGILKYRYAQLIKKLLLQACILGKGLGVNYIVGQPYSTLRSRNRSRKVVPPNMKSTLPKVQEPTCMLFFVTSGEESVRSIVFVMRGMLVMFHANVQPIQGSNGTD